MVGWREVLSFWFDEIDPQQWWIKDADFDGLVRRRFAAVHARAGAGELSDWRRSPDGRLAEVVVLDQFSRNMFRHTPRSFDFDPMALVLAQEAVTAGADAALPETRRAFLYMPYMHSESRVIQEQSVALFERLGSHLDFALQHKAIIDRFGRYPHRNEILGRPSTDEETAFLKTPDSSF